MKVVIVGAGLTGATWARLFADRGDQVTVLEELDHIGGNCFDHWDESTKVHVHNYGPHVFHTNSKETWEFVNRFTKFNSYKHRVLAHTSIGDFFIPRPLSCKLSEDQIIEAVFKSYSVKQWGKSWDTLPETVKKRVLKKRDIECDDYFTDVYQGIPINGYSCMFKNMLDHPNIKTVLNCHVNFRSAALASFDIVVITSSIDDFFDYSLGALPYKSARFYHYKRHNTGNNLSTSWEYCINDCTLDNSYTRTWDNKTWLMNTNREPETIVTEEYSVTYRPNSNLVRTHPIVEPDNLELYQNYLKLSTDNRFIFSGRLGKYQYINMEEAVMTAIEGFNAISKPTKMFIFYSDAFVNLRNLFTSTFKDSPKDIEIIEVVMDIQGVGNFLDKGYKTCLFQRMQKIFQIITECPNEIIIISDVDIQFFRPIKDIIMKSMEDKDIVFQRENKHKEEANSGFYAIRCNDKVLAFLKKVYEITLSQDTFDQPIFNSLLSSGKEDVRWGLFPQEIWAFSQYNIDEVKETIVLHHANCTIPQNGLSSIELKVQQLKAIRDKVSMTSPKTTT